MFESLGQRYSQEDPSREDPALQQTLSTREILVIASVPPILSILCFAWVVALRDLEPPLRVWKGSLALFVVVSSAYILPRFVGTLVGRLCLVLSLVGYVAFVAYLTAVAGFFLLLLFGGH